MTTKKWRVVKCNGWWQACDPVVTRQYGRKVYHIIQFPHWQQAMDYAVGATIGITGAAE